MWIFEHSLTHTHTLITSCTCFLHPCAFNNKLFLQLMFGLLKNLKRIHHSIGLNTQLNGILFLLEKDVEEINVNKFGELHLEHECISPQSLLHIFQSYDKQLGEPLINVSSCCLLFPHIVYFDAHLITIIAIVISCSYHAA